MRGRKPTPTALKLVTGNPGHRPLNVEEPEYPVMDEAAFADVPAEIADDSEAVTEWHRLATMLAGARRVTEGDRAALIALCHHWSRYLRNTKSVGKNELIRDPAGQPMVNPFLTIADRAYANCTKGWAILGLTATEKARATGGGTRTKLEKFLANKKRRA